jgi:hypothetical protein
MKTYEIKKEGEKYNIYYSDGLKEFHSLDGINGEIKQGYININTSTQALQYSKDKEFGVKLMDIFLIDNRESPIAFNPSISGALLQKMQSIKALAEVGDIKTVKYLLSVAEIDAIFTQERKDKYILMCNNHLGL